MKISLPQLKKHLSGGLSAVYFVAGDEPLLAAEALDAIRKAARADGYEDREVFVPGTGFDWDSIRSSAGNMSLFASRRIVEVRLPTGKPGRTGGPMLADLAENPPPDTMLIIIAEQFDSAVAKAKWVARVSDAGTAVIIKPIALEQLPGWIEKDFHRHKLSFEPEVIQLLTHRVEGNLLAARQEVDKLALLADDGHVSVELATQSVSDGARFDVFQLSDAAHSPDSRRAIRILYGLRAEGVAAPLVLWALAREATTLVSVWQAVDEGQSSGLAMKQARVWGPRQQLIPACLRRHSRESVESLLTLAAMADRVVKGAKRGEPWDALLELLLAIGQPADGMQGQLSA